MKIQSHTNNSPNFKKLVNHHWLVIILACMSCQNNTVKAPGVLNIDFEAGIENYQQVFLSQLCDSLSYIPLETSEFSLIREIVQVRITEGYIFINSRYQKVLQYDHHGRFIRQIGRRGNGPGEYASIVYYFDVSEELQRIFLGGFYEIYEYSFQGDFIRSMKINVLDQFACIEPDKFVINHINRGNETNKLLFINKEKDTLMRIPFSHMRGKQSVIEMVWGKDELRQYFTPSGQDILFRSEYDDTIFAIADDMTLRPRIVLHMGKHHIPFENQVESLNSWEQYRKVSHDYYRLVVYDLPKYTIIKFRNFLFRESKEFLDDGFLLHDKALKETVRVIPIDGAKSNLSYFFNDIDGGFAFSPQTISEDSRFLVNWLPADVFLDGTAQLLKNANDSLRQDSRFQHFTTVSNHLKMDSNPVVVLARLK